MRLVLWTVVGLVTVVVAGIGWVAWTRWPPFVHYRVNRIDAQTRVVVQRYLDGTQPLEPAARALATLYHAKTLLISRLPSRLPSGASGSLEAITIAVPDGVPPEDPRMRVLGDRMWDYMIGPEAAERLRKMERDHQAGT